MSSSSPPPVTHTPHTHRKTWTLKKAHTVECPTVRGWGQVCSSSSMIPKDSWDVAVVPVLCDSASVGRCLSPHHSVSFSFLCFPAHSLLCLSVCPPLSSSSSSSPLIPWCREEEAVRRSHSASIAWYHKRDELCL